MIQYCRHCDKTMNLYDGDLTFICSACLDATPYVTYKPGDTPRGDEKDQIIADLKDKLAKAEKEIEGLKIELMFAKQYGSQIRVTRS